jgi:pimeloyl-ACP methyl ester carboxylesterase
MEERDPALELQRVEWPREAPRPPRWKVRKDAGLLQRNIIGGEEPESALSTPLKERILRFPSAPIHGLHRLSQEHVNMGPVESFHSFRLLSHCTSRKPVSRIFLLHNGLNETRRMGFYYQLASHLIEQDHGTVCLLRPFPGHFTRCAFPGLTETPLDHYLWDGLHLFRQFLRYMIETRWLLSSVVRYSAYHCASGSGLLGENISVEKSRLDTAYLAAEMAQEWKRIGNASRKAIRHRRTKSPKVPPAPPVEAFENTIDSLREALGLQRRQALDGSEFDPKIEPELHAIGYSLGGFAAQSVFMSWGFLISSCSTLLSGGAMRELAPTAFADPEEWQTVLHSLRYELDDAMMDWRFNRTSGRRVAGIDPYLFLYLKRTFYEVFQQEYRGSIQTRLESFRQRMLFVVGGSDPIVQPKSVLDSSPPDGINMISVGGLGHFLGDSPQGQVEKEQREFWMPEISRTIGCLAEAAAKKHRSDLESTWLGEDDLLPGPDGEEEDPDENDYTSPEKLSIAERLEVERDGTLSNRLFQRSLDDLLARAEVTPGEGLLFVLKNDAPTFLLDERALQQHAAALYHEDVGIVEYIREVRSRRPILRAARQRVCVVLPWNLETIVRDIDAGLQHPSQSEGSGEQMAKAPNSKTNWKNLHAKCLAWSSDKNHESVRVFDGRKGIDEMSPLRDVVLERLGIERSAHVLTSALPDCWVWMSNEFLGRKKDAPLSVASGLDSISQEVLPYVKKTRESEREIAKQMQKDDLRMLTHSRARYNPRFRGRIVAEPRPAQELLLRVALCIDASIPYSRFDFKSVSPDRHRAAKSKKKTRQAVAGRERNGLPH